MIKHVHDGPYFDARCIMCWNGVEGMPVVEAFRLLRKVYRAAWGQTDDKPEPSKFDQLRESLMALTQAEQNRLYCWMYDALKCRR